MDMVLRKKGGHFFFIGNGAEIRPLEKGRKSPGHHIVGACDLCMHTRHNQLKLLPC